MGLRGAAHGRPAFSLSLFFKCIYFFCSNKSPDSLCVIHRACFFFCFFFGAAGSEMSASIPRKELGRGAANQKSVRQTRSTRA